MSRSRSRPGAESGANRPDGPRAAHDALLDGAAADPLRRALWLDAVDLRLRPHLPPSLAAHARLANIDGAKLVFLVDSPVWHARMRLAATELLNLARSIGLDVTELVVKTTTQPLRPLLQTSTTAPATHLSAAAREAFQTALASFDSSDPLKKDES